MKLPTRSHKLAQGILRKVSPGKPAFLVSRVIPVWNLLSPKCYHAKNINIFKVSFDENTKLCFDIFTGSGII